MIAHGMKKAALSRGRRIPAGSRVVEGYASVFGQEDMSGDIVRAGAFSRSLCASRGSIPMLYQHRSGHFAGRWTRIEEDASGLKVRGLVTTETASGRAALRQMSEEELSGLSIGFVAETWSERADGGRVLKRLQLREVSLVTSPMLPSARFVPLT